LAKKDVQSEVAADETEDGAYWNTTIEDLAGKLKVFQAADPKTEALLIKGPQRTAKPRRLVRYGNKEIGIYAGEWAPNDYKKSNIMKREMRHGHGILIAWPTGNLYEGQWMNDKLNGLARMIKTDGSVFEGAWVNDQQTGLGKMTLDNGTTFEGKFFQGRKHGHGKFQWEDSS